MNIAKGRKLKQAKRGVIERGVRKSYAIEPNNDLNSIQINGDHYSTIKWRQSALTTASPSQFHLLNPISPSKATTDGATNLSETKQLHAALIKTGLVHSRPSQNRHVALYAAADHDSGAINFALLFFSRSPKPTAFMRNTIVQSIASSDSPANAIHFYRAAHLAGIPPNHHTFPAILKACSRLLALHEGQQMHAHSLKSGLDQTLLVRNALVHLYATCGNLTDARLLFNEMSERDIVTWNSLIAGYSKHSLSQEALDLFRTLQKTPYPRPDAITAASALSACAQAGTFELGEWVHAYAKKHKIDQGIAVRTALIDMYSRCGAIDRATEIFKFTPLRNLVCWTAMITGLAVNGRDPEAVNLFHRMVRSGVRPDRIAFVSVLSACSHAGMVDDGKRLLNEMKTRFRLDPGPEHYGCMVDLLGRAGQLEEALGVIRSSPSAQSETVLWRTLLGASSERCEVEMAELAMSEIARVEPRHHGDWVLMANVYSNAGRKEEAARVRREMRREKIRKERGCSVIEVGGKIYSFAVEGE